MSSIESIEDIKTINFADMSLKWWDKKLGWYQKGCVALTDDENRHLSYIFYKIDRYNNYLTIHNIFTSQINRRHGYAKMLLMFIFNIAVTENVKRFRLTSISSSLDFYLSLGFIYWGVNSVGDYYCDLPLPPSGLAGVSAMTEDFSTLALIGKSFEVISKKIADNSEHLSKIQMLKYDSDIIKLGSSYLQESFFDIKNSL